MINTETRNKEAGNAAGARPNILYGNMLDQMRYFEALSYVYGLDVLDIACGVGWGSYLMSMAGARKVYGVDLSEAALSEAQKYYCNQKIGYLLGTSSKIPLNNSSVDVITSFETFEHVEDTGLFIDELHRVARPSAILLLSTPNAYSTKKSIDHKPENPFHFQEYLKTDVISAFSERGWDMLSYKGQYPMRINGDEIMEYRRFIY
jgi:2-polyprenyl-3-methyl-5-hydroxy-6-metoxy-1,4-benzoquinol methylase